MPYERSFKFNSFNSNEKNKHENIIVKYHKQKSVYVNIKYKKISTVYLFGNQKDYFFKNYRKINRINFPLMVSCNKCDSEKSCVVFARENGKIFLLMKINFFQLSKNKKLFLLNEFDIININSFYYINMGNIHNSNQILSNIENFLNKVFIKKPSFDFIRVKYIKKMNFQVKNTLSNKSLKNNANSDFSKVYNNDFSELFTSKTHHGSNLNFCKICNDNISKSFLDNPQLKNIIKKNQNVCANCFSSALISYFKLRIGEKYTNKSYLLSNSKNTDLIKFYINLAEMNGALNRGFEIKFNENHNQIKQTGIKIPKKLKIRQLPAGKKGVSEIINIIDKNTLNNNFSLSTDFQDLLIKYNLSEKDGWEIRKKLIEEAKSGKLNKTHKSIKKRILILINNRYEKKHEINLFNLILKLNELTLDNENDLNNDFMKKLENNNINKNDGMKIRKTIINEINNLTLVNKKAIEHEIDYLIKWNI